MRLSFSRLKFSVVQVIHLYIGQYFFLSYLFNIELDKLSTEKCIYKIVGSTINSHLATILVGLVQLISNIAALFVIDKAGRKPLLVISAVIMSLSMASMGTAFYLKQQNIESFGQVQQLQ